MGTRAADHGAWIERAIDLAVESVASGGGPFGAVVTRGGEAVAEGFNRVTVAADPTAHGEVVAIRRAAERLGTHDLSGCVLYTSCEPCPMCVGAIAWARLDACYYAASAADAAAGGFDDQNFHEQVALPPAQREQPTRHLAADRAMRPFEAWAARAGRVEY
ncbi:nucleoside deaminase [Phycisphaera mikurensis]|uniref:Guanine deaminase n=1 Tax=Phycisphaera mikurensis (strain NBRC 102666 / KCTC 22515 / FYK2301M01) TaxID=1142394 RepID=I0IB10_PHYMF|nr:nucleoside deaminase [Phycisphaera mikurensis]MBB6442580.1 tRNA(Arg) A34 adenosine deaminase TadA [Phycisphaera mikurensis]BAM02448.1 guanine deaminase [Phycisphaera mikurensis NBRC 102666]